MDTPQQTKQKRILLFLIGCIGARSYITWLAKTRLDLLPLLGKLGLVIAIGFTLIYIFGWRKTGPEVFGDKIWWNHLRPVHAILWGLFAYFALNGPVEEAWKPLAADTLIGLLAFINHHYLQAV